MASEKTGHAIDSSVAERVEGWAALQLFTHFMGGQQL